MPPQYKLFTINIYDHQAAEEELNRFLRSVRVLAIQKELVVQGERVCWAFAVEYLEDVAVTAAFGSAKDGRKRIDYRELLPPEDFAIFARLREWRKEVADREAVPVYTVFTNEQLARIAGERVMTIAALSALDGVGEARLSKYGEAVVALVRDLHEQQRQATS